MVSRTEQTVETVSTETLSALRVRVIEDYRGGMSLWAVSNKWASTFGKAEVRRILEGVLRPRGSQKFEPSEEEVALRSEEIKNKWTPEQASRRWVGRYLSRPESLGEGLSRELRRMGGNC